MKKCTILIVLCFLTMIARPSFSRTSINLFVLSASYLENTGIHKAIDLKKEPNHSSIRLETTCEDNPIRIENLKIEDVKRINEANAVYGSIKISLNGGKKPYTYKWSGPDGYQASEAWIRELKAGKYTVEVLDANQCRVFFTYYVMETACVGGALKVEAEVTDVFTRFAPNIGLGSICITVLNGKAPFIYQWTGPNNFESTEQNIKALVVDGDYKLKVVDANGCEGNYTYNVRDDKYCSSRIAPLRLVIDEIRHTTIDRADGAIFVSIPSPLPLSPGDLWEEPYTYYWRGPDGFTANTQDIQNLVPGTYILEVYDANGCKASYATYIVREEDCSKTNVSIHTNYEIGHVKMVDENTVVYGVINVYASLSSSDESSYPSQRHLIYEWTGPEGFTASEPKIKNLKAGQYTLKISLANGCSVYRHYTIREVSCQSDKPLFIRLNKLQDIAYLPDDILDGYIDVTIEEGVAPYEFHWSVPNGDIQSFYGQSNQFRYTVPLNFPGEYHLEVYDANGCKGTASYIVTRISTTCLRAPIQVKLDRLQHVSGGRKGAIEVTASGGMPVYTYYWTGPNGFKSSEKNISNLEVGEYILEVFDQRKCKTLIAYYIEDLNIKSLTPTPSENLLLYPNPSSGILYLEHPSIQPINVVVLNMMGQVLLKKQLTGDYHGNLDVSQLGKGIYLLKTVIGGKVVLSKFILE